MTKEDAIKVIESLIDFAINKGGLHINDVSAMFDALNTIKLPDKKEK